MSDYFDEYAKHIIDTEFYAQQMEEEFTVFLEELKDKIKSIMHRHEKIPSKKVYNEVKKECEEIIDEQIDDYFDELEEKQQEQSEKERKFLDKLFGAAFGIALADSIIKNRKILMLPYNRTDTNETFRENLKQNMKKSVKTPLISAYVFGSTASSTEESFESAVSRINKNGKSDIHTSVTSVQRNTQKVLLLGNKKIKYQYISMLDEKTCVSCGSYSGNVYDSLEEAPEIPVHNRCRCYYLPVKEKTDEPSYEDWLKSQPDSVAYKILGPSRYALYKAGINISKFTSEGHTLTLEELYKNI